MSEYSHGEEHNMQSLKWFMRAMLLFESIYLQQAIVGDLKQQFDI
jgi:hypothetical protein